MGKQRRTVVQRTAAVGAGVLLVSTMWTGTALAQTLPIDPVGGTTTTTGAAPTTTSGSSATTTSGSSATTTATGSGPTAPLCSALYGGIATLNQQIAAIQGGGTLLSLPGLPTTLPDAQSALNSLVALIPGCSNPTDGGQQATGPGPYQPGPGVGPYDPCYDKHGDHHGGYSGGYSGGGTSTSSSATSTSSSSTTTTGATPTTTSSTPTSTTSSSSTTTSSDVIPSIAPHAAAPAAGKGIAAPAALPGKANAAVPGAVAPQASPYSAGTSTDQYGASQPAYTASQPGYAGAPAYSGSPSYSGASTYGSSNPYGNTAYDNSPPAFDPGPPFGDHHVDDCHNGSGPYHPGDDHGHHDDQVSDKPSGSVNTGDGSTGR